MAITPVVGKPPAPNFHAWIEQDADGTVRFVVGDPHRGGPCCESLVTIRPDGTCVVIDPTDPNNYHFRLGLKRPATAKPAAGPWDGTPAKV